ncbi:MAG TPA: VWA domain-containing protein, partial [Candidatus Koribacter sp.]
MHLRNKLFPIRVLPLALLGTLAFAQGQQQPNLQPGQQGKVDGGLIQPIDNQPQQPAQGQAPAGQQGKVEGGVIQPIDSAPSQAQSGNTGAIAPIDDGQPVNWAHHEPPPTQPAANQPVEAAAPATKSPNQPGDTVNVPSTQKGQAAESTSGGGYLFKAQVEEVHLNATVVDERGRLITTLDKNAFTVFENGQPQQIKHFQHEDIPVALGIVIDNSGSMRDKRPAVNTAAVNLVKASNPQDEVFVVNFNDDYYLDQDYTDQVPKLKEALERYETRGGTALYDAVLASNDHLMKAQKLEKKVLFVVTDGEDDASLNTLEQTIRKVQKENGPTIYTIGILDEQGSHKRKAMRALREMAES